jgi:hypothetical protein
MKFFLKAKYHVVHKGFLMFTQPFHELISIAIFCENGNAYYGISRALSTYQVTQETSLDIIDHLPKRSNVLWRSRVNLAFDIMNFMKFHAGDKTIELLGYQCAVDFSLFKLLIGSLMELPEYCHDIHQDIREIAGDLSTAEFTENENFKDFPPLDEATIDEKVQCFHSHKEAPDNPGNTAFEEAIWVGKTYAFLQDYKQEMANNSLNEIPDTHGS